MVASSSSRPAAEKSPRQLGHAKALLERRVDAGQRRPRRQPPGLAALALGPFRRVREAMICGQRHHIGVAADGAVEVLKKALQMAVQVQQVVLRQARLRAHRVVDVVMAGETDGEDVGVATLAQALGFNSGAGKGQGQLVAKGAGQQVAVEARARCVHLVAHDGRQPVAVAVATCQVWPSGTERA